MKRAWLLILPTGAALAVAAVAACSMNADFAAHITGGTGATGQGGGGASTGTSSGGDAGVDALFGGGSSPVGPIDYSDLCGAGCIPAADDPSACGGVGGGAQNYETCVLGYDAASDTVLGECLASGLSAEGAPCLSTAQCGPGLACGDGACRRYCCGELEACPEATYCAPRPLDPQDLPPDVSDPPLVPLCVPIDPCELLSPSTCPEGQSCTIVRAAGTTSCVALGHGTAGQACPCAADHYCATALGECFQLCHTTSTSDCPAGFACQGGNAPFPEGFGICVPQ